jgi:HEAT repeat protein
VAVYRTSAAAAGTVAVAIAACALPGVSSLLESVALAQVAPAAPAAATTLADPTPELERRAVDSLLATLRNRTARPDQREAAARQLLRRTAPPTRATVTAALRDLLRAADDAPGRIAAARAIAADPSPDPALAGALGTMLGLNRELTPAATQALAAFKGDRHAFDLLAQFAARNDPNTTSAPTRAAAIKAMGRFVERYSAQALVQLLSDRTPAVRTAAAEALMEMTGLSEFNHDAPRWQQWMQAGASRTDEQWKADLIAPRSARQDREREQYADLRAEMEARLSSLFLATPNDKKQALALSLLGSPSPDVRSVGAALVTQYVKEAGRVDDPVKGRLVNLVSDPSAKVRAAAVDALGTISYEPALDALLVQLAIEPDANVRGGIVNVLGRIGGTRQVPALLARIGGATGGTGAGDPSPDVRERAARALEQLGPEIRNSPPLATAAAGRLQAAVAQPNGGDADTDERLRDAYARALVPLLSPDALVDLANRLLNTERRGPMRRIGLRLLAATDDPNQAVRVVQVLRDDRDPGVRAEALRALGRLGGPEESAIFLSSIQAPQEPPEVRDAAWQGLQLLLPKMDLPKLYATAQALRNEPEKAVRANELAAEKQRAAGNLDEWALVKVNIATNYRDVADWDAAIRNYREALDYYLKTKGQPPQNHEVLIGELLTAYLRGGRYEDATQLASGVTGILPLQETAGIRFWKEADRLFAEGQRTNDRARWAEATSVINAGMAVNPPLATLHRNYLQRIAQQIESGSRGARGSAPSRNP